MNDNDTINTKVTLKDDVEHEFQPLFHVLNEKNDNLDRTNEKGFVNEQTGSSMTIREDGQVNLAAGMYSQFKITPDGKTRLIAMENTVSTNRHNFEVDEITVNHHKMNPALWELADMRQVMDNTRNAIGDLTMFATVLVKAWEPHLKKYVMIRRLARIPMFSPMVNTALIPQALNIVDPTASQGVSLPAVSPQTDTQDTQDTTGANATNNKSGSPTDTQGTTPSSNATDNNQTTAAQTDKLSDVKNIDKTFTQVATASEPMIDSLSSSTTTNATQQAETEAAQIIASGITTGKQVVDQSLTQIMVDSATQTMQQYKGKDPAVVNAALQSTIGAVQKVFDANSDTILKAAASVQQQIDSLVATKVAELQNGATGVDLKQTLLSQVSGTFGNSPIEVQSINKLVTEQLTKEVQDQVAALMDGTSGNSSILSQIDISSIKSEISKLATFAQSDIQAQMATQIQELATVEQQNLTKTFEQLSLFDSQTALDSLSTDKLFGSLNISNVDNQLSSSISDALGQIPS